MEINHSMFIRGLDSTMFYYAKKFLKAVDPSYIIYEKREKAMLIMLKIKNFKDKEYKFKTQ